MKTDKELLKIWKKCENQENFKEQNNYLNLSIKEKARLFDLIIKENIRKKGGYK